MANKQLLTYGAKAKQVEQAYFAPTAGVISTYMFLANVDPWDDDDNPPAPTQDQSSIKNTFKKIFAAKQVTVNDITPVIQRIDWTSGVTYDYYDDTVDMFEIDQNGYFVRSFYVKNKYDQIFKCLWNNNDSPSTSEPFFQPGNYSPNNIYQGDDGYKWKYIYTVEIGTKVKFMDSDWLPIPVGDRTPNPLTSAAGVGCIDVINVIDGGSDYVPGTSPITVTITGDGSGATAQVANVTNGSITDITVLTPGTNYSFANVAITSANGSGVIVTAPISPVSGHGYDPISELGCAHVMYCVEFNGPEYINGVVNVPTDITYYQVGLVIDPVSTETSPNFANGTIYRTTTDLTVASGFGTYLSDELLYQGTSLSASTFKGTVLSHDTGNNVVKLINTVGTLTFNAPVFGNTTQTVRTLLTSSSPSYVVSSGYMAYIENRSGIQRSNDGIEQFKIILGF
jgi:hypothetical protein